MTRGTENRDTRSVLNSKTYLEKYKLFIFLLYRILPCVIGPGKQTQTRRSSPSQLHKIHTRITLSPVPWPSS